MMNKLFRRLLGGGDKRVRLDEMANPPQLTVDDNGVHVRVWNSLQNSSLGIHRVTFDKKDDTLFFVAYQQLVTMVRDPSTFSFGFGELGISGEEIANYKMCWLDPDGNTTELALMS